MNLKQVINLSFLGINISAVLIGVMRIETSAAQAPLEMWLFISMFVFLRFKFFLDDHEYFSKPNQDHNHFAIGFVLAIASWLLWAISGYHVPDLESAYLLLGIALTISTFWIVVVGLRDGAYKNQYLWFGCNAVYVIVLWMLYALHGDAEYGYFSYMLYLGFGVALAVDYFYSDSFKQLHVKGKA